MMIDFILQISGIRILCCGSGVEGFAKLEAEGILSAWEWFQKRCHEPEAALTPLNKFLPL